MKKDDHYFESIAIIGMAGRFPGANSVEHFWKNLKNGIESIACATSSNESNNTSEHFIKVNTNLEDIDLFDAHFFNISTREAEIMDPQHRLFLECSWEALENAGYDPSRYEGLIGLYAGSYANYYLLNNVYPISKQIDAAQELRVMIGNEKDHMTTYVAYKLNLCGPVITVQTACSTSLAAVHLGCESLLTHASDIVLAGGVTISVSQQNGYYYQEGGLLSSDGHCHVFDAKANGTVYSNGLGVVVLKRLKDAIRDGDTIYAVIRGSAISNDGSARVGYVAPGITGQINVIARALANAEVNAETVTYIEAHGTGTPLGDEIEIEALQKIFTLHTKKKGFCALGSVKSNIGHLGVASGISGLIKTVLSLHNKVIPASINFELPNPKLDVFNGPFYVNTSVSDWIVDDIPRRAGISSFGLGGTNVHMIVEEAIQDIFFEDDLDYKILILSAKTEKTLNTIIKNLTGYLRQHSDINCADMAYTLQVGRQEFEYRSMTVVTSIEETIKILEQKDNSNLLTIHYQKSGSRSIIFLFPGKTNQYDGNVLEKIYKHEPCFANYVKECINELLSYFPINISDILFADIVIDEKSRLSLSKDSFNEIRLFVIEYALAKLWVEWGISPSGVIGIGIGKYVAACIAGIFSLEDAIKLVIFRTSLILKSNHQDCIDHEIKDKALLMIKEITLHNPSIPFLSQENNDWITSKDSIDHKYWSSQLCGVSNILPDIEKIFKNDPHIFLDIGPDNSLRNYFTECLTLTCDQIVLSSLGCQHNTGIEFINLFMTLGVLWLLGAKINWERYYDAHKKRQRIPLPTYPFERKRFWINSIETKDVASEPSCAYQQFEKSNDCLSSTNDIEKTIAQIWEHHLGVKLVGIKDNFFELGGDSLSAVTIVNVIRNRFLVDIQLRTFLECQTIEKIAKFIVKK